jgi:hypothetical protein
LVLMVIASAYRIPGFACAKLLCSPKGASLIVVWRHTAGNLE